MHEHIKYLAKQSASALFSFIKINALGFFSTLTTFIIGLMLCIKGSAGHISAAGFLVMMVTTKPVSAVLLLVIFLSPILFFILGNKYIIGKIAHRLLNDKGDTILVPLIDRILAKFKTSQPGLLSKGADKALAKMKLIQQAKNEHENWVIKKILVYAMKKIQLNDVDFSKDDQELTLIIRNKIIVALKEMIKPSRKWILILVALQWVFLLLIWLLPV